MKLDTTPRYRKSLLAQSLAVALTLPLATFALAQNDPAKADAEESDDAKTEQQFEAVNIVGSRIKRAEVEGPAPVVVISRTDFEREGFTTVADALQTLTQNTTSSFTGDLAVTGFSPNAQVVNLRNLGPGYTLTLINGRRPAQYPQPYNRDNNVVNLKAIPSSIVERVEILTGGASAIYGSDAVAGVVNIVLREGYEGNFVTGRYGTTDEGGGDSYNLEFGGGASGDRWSVTYALQYGQNDPVFASQREFLSDLRNGPLGPGFTNPQLALIAIRISNAQPGSALNQNAYYNAAACNAFGYTTVTTAARGQYCGGYTAPASRSISNEQEFKSAYAYGTFDLTESVQLFGSLTWYDQEAAASAGTEFWGTSGDRFLTTRTGGATSSYFDPQIGALVQLQRIFNPFELGGNKAASTLYDEETYDVSFGANGVLGEAFDWEASIAHSEYDYSANRPRLLAQAVHNYFLGPLEGYSGNTPGSTGNFPIHRLNLARWNTPITPDIYRSFATRVINQGETDSSTFNFTVSGDLFELPAGMVGFAGVLEAGNQGFVLRSDPRLNQLLPPGPGTVYNLVSSGNTTGERDRYAVGAEFRVPLHETLTLNLAGRYDKYDDITEVDDAFTHQLGLEWRPLDSLLFRASYATSFRAPDMQLVFAEGAASFSTILDEYACRSGVGLGLTTGPRTREACNRTGDATLYSAQTRVAGNPLLKEEEGESYTGGFVYDITDSMSVSVDYYRIKLEDAATQLANATILEAEANCRLGVRRDGSPFPNSLDSAFCQNVLGLITRLPANPGTALDQRIDRINSAYINSALIDTDGIDATYKWRIDTDRAGTFTLDLGYSLVLSNKYKENDDDILEDFRDSPLVNDQRSRMRGSLTWGFRDWTTTLFAQRLGSNGSFAAVDGVNLAGGGYPRRLEPWMLYNLSVARNFGENLNATLTVINVLDEQYRKDNSFTGYPFYDNFIGADPLGRRYNLSVTWKF